MPPTSDNTQDTKADLFWKWWAHKTTPDKMREEITLKSLNLWWSQTEFSLDAKVHCTTVLFQYAPNPVPPAVSEYTCTKGISDLQFLFQFLRQANKVVWGFYSGWVHRLPAAKSTSLPHSTTRKIQVAQQHLKFIQGCFHSPLEQDRQLILVQMLILFSATIGPARSRPAELFQVVHKLVQSGTLEERSVE